MGQPQPEQLHQRHVDGRRDDPHVLFANIQPFCPGQTITWEYQLEVVFEFARTSDVAAW